MKINFRDFYGQHVEVCDETASGNVRIKVNTNAELKVRGLKPEECELETDISLTQEQVGMLISVLNNMHSEEE